MKPSLYSKIRPASEIKQVNTEFKVANDAIALRATKTEMQTNTGENKWLVSRYDMNLGGPTVVPTFEHIQGKNATEKVEMDDAQIMYPFNAEYYIAHFFTNVYVDAEKTVNLAIKNDDISTLYVNGVLISTNVGYSTATNVAMLLKQGWNRVEFLFYEHAGAQNLDLGLKLSSNVTRMSIIGGGASVVDTRISLAELKVTPDAITSTVTEHATYKNDVAQKIDNIKVGGRNFLRNSKPPQPIQNAVYNIATFSLSEAIAYGETVTVSIKGELGADRTGFGVYNTGGSVHVMTLGAADRGADGVYRKTGIWVVAGAGNTNATIYQFTNSGTSQSKIEWIKLEKGNKATDWTEAPEDIEAYIQSRGENLITNGTGLLGNNTNFSGATFNSSDAYSANGSFTSTDVWTGPWNDELIPVNPDNTYRFKYYAKANPLVGTPKIYGYIVSHDADGNGIQPSYTMYRANTTTTLKNTLSPGATTVTLTSAANWLNTGDANNSYERSFIFWNYVNKGGYAWPEHTYSRNYYENMWNAGGVNTSTGVITLRVPWAGPTIPAGTKVSNGTSGATYKYIAGAASLVPSTWQVFEGTMGEIDYSGQNVTNKFHPGTASVKIGWILNVDGSGSKTWLSNISLQIDHEGEIKKTQSQITQTANKISLVVKEENGQNKVDGHALVSAINVQPNTIKIESKNIDITGAVTFSSLDANVLSTISEDSSLLNINPTFSRWTSTYPEGYVASVGAAPTKVASDNGKPNAVQMAVTAGTEQYMYQNILGMGLHQYVTVEATFKLVSGGVGGAGILTRFANSSGGTIQDFHLNFKQLVPSPVIGRWYTVSKTFKATSITNLDRYYLFVMAGWATFGTIEAKTIEFDSVKLRPALESEVQAYDTKGTVESWRQSGKTTINGGAIETNTIDVNRLKAGTISADTIKITSATSGVTFDSTGIKATKGSTVVSMNSGVGFKITNGAEDVFRVESDGMIFAKGLTTLSQFNNLKVGGRNIFRESGNYISAPKFAWSSNGGGMELDQAVSYNGYPTIKTTVGAGIAGQWYTLKNDVEYVYSVTLSANAAFNTTASSGSSPVHYHAGLNNLNEGKISILEHSTQYLAGDVGKFKRIWIRFKLTGDANSFRPFIYFGSGTTVFNIANMQLEEGNMMTDWTPAPEDAGQDIYDLQERLAAAEQIITADAITSTVMASQSFTDKVDGKVNIEDLANYATTDALTEANKQLKEYADGKIESIDLSTYVTTTALTQTKSDFNIKLTSAGGVNLLQNSVGWAGGFNWTVTGSLATDGSGEYEVVKGTSELTGLGAGAAWKLNRRTIEQDVPVVDGETYTFQMLVKKQVNDAGGYIFIDEGNNAMVQRHTYRTDTAYNWTPFTYTFKAQGSNVKIRIQNTDTGNTLITNVMLNKGALPMQWTHAKNEIHNTNVRFDLGGIIVQNDATNGETRITPTEFAGYARDETGAQEKIFTLNGDTTEVKKLKASEEFSMGPLRILQIETPSGQTGPNGWAFLPRG